MSFPIIKQVNSNDCGPTALAMVIQHFGRMPNLNILRESCELGKDGVNLLGIASAAESVGLRTLSVEISFEKLIKEAPLPCIIHWNQNHFVVVTPNSTLKKIEVADPAHGIIKYSREEFCKHWLQTTDDVPGIALLLEPTPAFYQQKDSKAPGISWGFLLQYVAQYKRYFFQLVLGLIIASILQLIFPFLTQSIVDVGINTRNLQYIYIILFAQLFLFTGRIVTEFIRSHLLLHIGTRINISILSDFWINSFSVFDKFQGAIIKQVLSRNRFFLMIIEFPIEFSEMVESDFGYFFSSLNITTK
jgi:ATP-binding cassette subfamily B protein